MNQVKFFQSTKEVFENSDKDPNYLYYTTDTKELFKGEQKLAGDYIDPDWIPYLFGDLNWGEDIGTSVDYLDEYITEGGYGPKGTINLEFLIRFISYFTFDFEVVHSHVSAMKTLHYNNETGEYEEVYYNCHAELGLVYNLNIPKDFGLQVFLYTSSGKQIADWMISHDDVKDNPILYSDIYLYAYNTIVDHTENPPFEVPTSCSVEELKDISYIEYRLYDENWSGVQTPLKRAYLDQYNGVRWKTIQDV